MLELLVDPSDAPPPELLVEADPAVRARRRSTRVEGEREALLADLARVFPQGRELAVRELEAEASRLRKQGLDPDGLLPSVDQLFSQMKLGPTVEQIQGARLIMTLATLQRFVAGGAIVPALPVAVTDQFGVDMARIIGAIIEPWTSGRAPSSPAGDRMVRAMTRLAIELVEAVVGYFQPDPELLDAYVGEMERMAQRLNDLRARRRW